MTLSAYARDLIDTVDLDSRRRLHDMVELVRRTSTAHPALDRRATVRLPYPHAIHLTPLDPQTREPVGETRAVLGKELSSEGFGFSSFEPFHYRFAIVSMETEPGRFVAALGEALWCKFSRHGWYETGGRWIEPVASPLDEDAEERA